MGLDITGIGSVADLASNIVNKIWPKGADPNLKAANQLDIQRMLQADRNTVISAKENIMVAELNQSDKFTKRARPSVVYGGLLFIFLVYVAFPIAAFFTDKPMPDLSLPSDFWWVWGGICSVWSIGRTAEKKNAGGIGGKISGIITGNK